MFRRISHRVRQPKPAPMRVQQLQRAHQAAEARKRHPKPFEQPPPRLIS